MKTNPMKIKLTPAFWLAACTAWLMLPASSLAQVNLTDWLDNTGDGCLDWNAFQANGYNASVAGITNPTTTNAYSANLPIYPNVYSFAPNVVPGYPQSLEINEAGYDGGNLVLNLSFAQWQEFAANNQLSFTYSAPPWTAGGYSQLVGVTINCNGSLGYYGVPWNVNYWSVSGATNNDYSGNQPNFYFYNGSPLQSQTVTLNYSTLLPQITNNGYGYLQIIFQNNNGGGAPSYWYMNNVTLSDFANQSVYTVDDFSTNGVLSENPTNDDYFATDEPYNQGDISSVWSLWFGNGLTGVSWDPNVNVSGTTNANGAMALSFTWNGPAIDGYQQWLVWQGNGTCYTFVPGGTVGIGYPQYTNLECDVMFDASSAGTTNNAGVLGVIRMGIRAFGAYGQDWIPSSYTTISDTNWHHINAQLPNNNSDYTDIGAVIIGEDVTAYVGGGGLTGNQLLYVDNIRFTGPLVAPAIPPPTLGIPQPANPGLRIFAASSVNTYDREMLYTVDQNQSWVDAGAHYPVKYSFSLLEPINPNIGQTMLELIAPPTTPTTYGEYADYSGPTTLWLQLNPMANGQVVAQVQWKTNAPGSNPGNPGNPYGQALAFTNSTSVGTWSLVFTGPTTGYVGAPGQVILGSTNFTIADGTVTTDFGDPGLFVGFGLQPNSTAGEGQYEDWGMISVTGVVDGNEFEDFTKEGSDISGNVTPSGLFNNSMSAAPAGTIIQETNDAWWVNWTQPAANFTLATSTNLLHPNWINPAYYGGYIDDVAPRVLPLAAPFVNKFWVLVPYDDLPTANGQPNPTPPQHGALSPKAFFLVSTNVASP